MEKTIHSPADFMEFRSEMGWKISDTVRHDEEPRFDTKGVWMDNVNVIDYHYNDENGNPMGCLQVVIGEEFTEASWMDFEWDF